MFRKNNKVFLAVSGIMAADFDGEDEGPFRVCETNHKNRLVLNRYFPWTAPRAFGANAATFGFGDRLGYANAAQVAVAARTQIKPVLAQQSLRELSLTGRKNSDVIDVAAWAVMREGYRGGYACDGDHLKTAEEIADALADGCSMITLDCSLVLHKCDGDECALNAVFDAYPADKKSRLTADYLENDDVKALGLSFSKPLLASLEAVYRDAVKLAADVYFNHLRNAGREIDFELSLDETESTTTPEAHYYVARELLNMGVRVTNMAPRFVGEFQKAIDYMGDLDELDSSVAVHARIADYFGHKLSLHSASEKFSALPIIAKHSGGRYHIKTSGTSWLEVVECIAKNAPTLYRKMHAIALEHINEAKKFYVVHCDLGKVPPLESVPDDRLADYLDYGNPDSRQLMHITYGFILENADLKAEILDFLDKNRKLYERETHNFDFKKILAALDEIDYKGYVTVECIPLGVGRDETAKLAIENLIACEPK